MRLHSAFTHSFLSSPALSVVSVRLFARTHNEETEDLICVENNLHTDEVISHPGWFTFWLQIWRQWSDKCRFLWMGNSKKRSYI